jgi:hypothetical protein
MNNPRIGIGLGLLMFVSLLFTSAAQDTTDTSRATRSLTGCLQKGDKANEYQLIAEHAKWDLKSENVRLADHVGHKVKIDGAVSNTAFHAMKEDLKAEVEKHPTETGNLTVTNLEMVSANCD